MNNAFHIADLIVKEIIGELTPAEKSELNSWINASPENRATYKKATNTNQQRSKLEVYRLFEQEKAWDRLDKELFAKTPVRFLSRKYLQYAAAILIPICLIAGSVFYFYNNADTSSLAQIDEHIKPGVQKATLVLSDGGAVDLDEQKSFETLQEGNAQIQLENKTLSYSSAEKIIESPVLVYNELVTPRGGGYNLKLADGTEVWLNAGSSLKFPVAFTDSTREVFLEGEAYFDVTHNGKPFIVNSGNMDVRVLGTSFNISAYPDDSDMVTTLVEGKVKLNFKTEDNAVASKILLPNDQATFSKPNEGLVVAEVSTSQYTSWIQGKLEFDNESLEEVMKRLARWYNFEYEFDNASAKESHFSARVSNTENLSSILEMLEMTSNIEFELNNNTIIIH